MTSSARMRDAVTAAAIRAIFCMQSPIRRYGAQTYPLRTKPRTAEPGRASSDRLIERRRATMRLQTIHQ